MSGKTSLVDAKHSHKPPRRNRRWPPRIRVYPFQRYIFTNDPSSSVKKKIRTIKKLNSTLLIEAARDRRVLHSFIGAELKVDTHASVQAALLDETDRHTDLEIQIRILQVYIEFHMLNKRFFSKDGKGLMSYEEKEEEYRLKKEVLKVKERERMAKKHLEELLLDCERLLEENKANERKIEELKKQKKAAEEAAEEEAEEEAEEPCVFIEIRKNNSDILRATEDRDEVGSMCYENKKRIFLLESEMKKLDVSMRNSMSEIAMMRNNRIPELEGSIAAAVAKGKEMEMEVMAMVHEEQEMEKTIGVLNARKDDAEKVLAILQKELEYKQEEIAYNVYALSQRDSEIEELQIEVDRLREFDMVSETKQQLEPLHKFVADAHKNNTLPILISSATIIFAAALVAKGRGLLAPFFPSLDELFW